MKYKKIIICLKFAVLITILATPMFAADKNRMKEWKGYQLSQGNGAPEEALKAFLTYANARKYDKSKEYAVKDLKFSNWPWQDEFYYEITQRGTIQEIIILDGGKSATPFLGEYYINFELRYKNSHPGKFVAGLIKQGVNWKVAMIHTFLEIKRP